MVPDRVAASATQRNDPILARACQAGACRRFALLPGGVADLTYRFTMDGDRITELVIAA